MSNPVFKNSSVFKDPNHNNPFLTDPTNPYGDQTVQGDSGSGNPVTYSNLLNKATLVLMILIPTFFVGWTMMPPALYIPVLVGGFILGLVIGFAKLYNPVMVGIYAASQGLLTGALSGMLETVAPGVVIQAVLATISVLATVFVLYRFAGLRTSPKLNRFVTIALVSYLVFSLVNLILQITGVIPGMFGIYGMTIAGIPLGIAIGGFAILLASYTLLGDFEFIDNAVASRRPEKEGWVAVYGLLVTVVWIYIEMLRLLTILNRD